MSQQTLTGSCLCGALQYAIEGEPVHFYHCHCSRCRKATGTGHASNVFVSGGSLQWTGDTDLIASYKLPEAERFTRTFCKTCGGPLPKDIPGMNLAIIPAGTLDNEPNISPEARIFQDSKTDWSCSGDEIHCFSTYPE
jgi:hypothetical protein